MGSGFKKTATPPAITHGYLSLRRWLSGGIWANSKSVRTLRKSFSKEMEKAKISKLKRGF
jgi:hypothetical protein